MNKIPTAKEYFEKYSNLYQFEEGSPEYLIDEEDYITSVIELIKLHVEAALKKADSKLTVRSFAGGNSEIVLTGSEDSTLNAYPASNIK